MNLYTGCCQGCLLYANSREELRNGYNELLAGVEVAELNPYHSDCDHFW